MVGGLVGGAVAIGLFSVMGEPVNGEGFRTGMSLIRGAVPHAALLIVGVSIALGAVFGALAGARDNGVVSSLGVFYGLVVWLLVGVIAMPLLLGISPLSLRHAHEAWPWVAGSMVVALAYASLMTAIVIAMRQAPRRRAVVVERDRGLRRAA